MRLKFWGKSEEEKRKEEEEKERNRPCPCPDCMFKSKLDKIADKSIRDLVSAVVVPPSIVKYADPHEKIKEAKQFEERGDISSAENCYRVAVISALVNKFDYNKILEEYSSFLGRAGLNSNALKAYDGLKQRQDAVDTLIKLYE